MFSFIAYPEINSVSVDTAVIYMYTVYIFCVSVTNFNKFSKLLTVLRSDICEYPRDYLARLCRTVSHISIRAVIAQLV
jgi:hypothetical protein